MAAADPGIALIGFLLTLVAAFGDILGGYLAVRQRPSRGRILFFIAIAAGFILGVTLLERIPASIDALGENGLVLVVAGFFILLVAEGLFASHAHAPPHSPAGLEAVARAGPEGGATAGAADDDPPEPHFHEDHGAHALVGRLSHEEPLISPTASLAAFVGLTIHAFFDGVAILAGFLVGPKLGVILFIAVMAHKLPEGLSMSSIMLAAGLGRARAFRTAILLAVATAAGGAVAFLLGSGDEVVVEAFLALATGSFLYIAATDLLPAVNQARQRWTLPVVGAGLLLFAATEAILHSAGFG